MPQKRQKKTYTVIPSRLVKIADEPKPMPKPKPNSKPKPKADPNVSVKIVEPKPKPKPKADIIPTVSFKEALETPADIVTARNNALRLLEPSEYVNAKVEGNNIIFDVRLSKDLSRNRSGFNTLLSTYINNLNNEADELPKSLKYKMPNFNSAEFEPIRRANNILNINERAVFTVPIDTILTTPDKYKTDLPSNLVNVQLFLKPEQQKALTDLAEIEREKREKEEKERMEARDVDVEEVEEPITEQIDRARGLDTQTQGTNITTLSNVIRTAFKAKTGINAELLRNLNKLYPEIMPILLKQLRKEGVSELLKGDAEGNILENLRQRERELIALNPEIKALPNIYFKKRKTQQKTRGLTRKPVIKGLTF